MTSNNMTLAVNAAMSEYKLRAARMGLLGDGGSLDSKRPQSWCEYGFQDDLEFSDFYRLYRRGGVAAGAVNKLVGTCWETLPWVIEGEEWDESREQTQWERKIAPLFKKGAFWRAFREADRRRLVARYSGLLLQFSGEEEWDQPVRRRVALLKMIPAWENALSPAKLGPFGEVLEWSYSAADGTSMAIHPDRVFILGDHSADGIGFLEPAFNNFVSLEKVEGGSGESFLKNAARQLSLNFDPEVDLNNIASMYGVSLDELHTKFNEAARELNRANDLLLITQGAQTTPLVSNVPDPRPTYDINLQSASAGVDTPSRILVGNQQGERASTEDQKYYNKRCMSRRNELSVEASDLLTKLMGLRVIPVKDNFTIMWDDLTESTDSEKLGNAKIMADINSAGLGLGEPTFDENEVRTAAGYEPRAVEEPLPEEDDEVEEPDADPADQSS